MSITTPSSAQNLKHTHHAETQALIVPFQVPRRGPCSVTFTIHPDDSPTTHGQDLVGIHDDVQVTAGYPVAKSAVASPVSRTYAAIYGWMQITMAHDPDEPWEMDPYPPFKDVNTPFAFWGAEPTLVDAPSRSREVKTYDWTARSFLCYSPDAAMTKSVVPILAFEWGFWIEDGKPYVKELKQLRINEVWNGHIELFEAQYKGWSFHKTTADVDGT